jgi:hypothetical protein
MFDTSSKAYDDMVEFMRADLDSGMRLSKIEIAARQIITEQGRDFDEEASLYVESGSRTLLRRNNAVLYPIDAVHLAENPDAVVRKNPEMDAKVKALYKIWKSL